jgi:hypothetical protein
MAIYERHKPESTVLYQSVARAWPKNEFEYAVNEQSISPHVTAEFERYKHCGILEQGFARLYCKDCQAERVNGFSCKGRGFCPSFGSQRALQKADRIEREVRPYARARQFVLTFPHQVRVIQEGRFVNFIPKNIFRLSQAELTAWMDHNAAKRSAIKIKARNFIGGFWDGLQVLFD